MGGVVELCLANHYSKI